MNTCNEASCGFGGVNQWVAMHVLSTPLMYLPRKANGFNENTSFYAGKHEISAKKPFGERIISIKILVSIRKTMAFYKKILRASRSFQ